MLRSPVAKRLAAATALGLWLSAPIGPATVRAAETPVQAEKSPPGDIPDSQVFVIYAGPGFSMKTPEGWSRKDGSNGAQFFDKYNRIDVTIADATVPPTVDSTKSQEATLVTSLGRAVVVGSVKDVALTGGKAVRIDYTSNSEPNSVTNKQIRLEGVRYLLFKAGKLVTLDMAAPLGADNVDQWALMANSLQIR